MPFLIRPAETRDLADLHRLASSLAAYGFLTLPSDREALRALLEISEASFFGRIAEKDRGKYLFVAAEEAGSPVIGCSLIIARHGRPESPHLYFQVDPKRRTLQLKSETRGRTELGGLILDPAYRGHPSRMGKRLSWARLLYIGRERRRFCREILSEFLPPFLADGRSPLWEAIGRRYTGMDYREADQLSRREKGFVKKNFPKKPLSIDSLPADAQEAIGVAGEAARPAVKILSEAGLRYLNQIDPFDGGPHYGAKTEEVRWDAIEGFLSEERGCRILF